MNGEPRISDEGMDVEPPPRPAWLLPAVVGVGGFALGLLVATTIGSTGPSEASPTLPPVPPATVVTQPGVSPEATVVGVDEEDRPTLEELVPGFEGTLYFADFRSSTSQERMNTWRSELSSPLPTDLPAGFPQMDASGTRMAMVRGQSLESDFRGGVISLHWNLSKSHHPFPDTDSFLGSGVTGLVWHATEPGQLAWIENEGEDRWVLRTGDVENSGQEVERVTVAEFEGISWPLYWDAEFFVVAIYEIESNDGPLFPAGPIIGLFDSGGTLLVTTDSGFVGRLATGEFVLVESPTDAGNGPVAFLADSTFEAIEDGNLGDGAIPMGIARSNQEEVSAMAFNTVDDGPSGVLVYSEAGVRECRFSSPRVGLYWSLDGEWLVTQGISSGSSSGNLSFIDPDTCAETRVLLPIETGTLAAVGR